MKRTLATSAALFVVFSAARAGATPAPKYLGPAGHPLHWFGSPGTGSDTPPSSMPLHIHFDSTNQQNVANALAVQAIKDGMAQWTSVACTNLIVDYPDAPSLAYHTGFNSDNHIVISFDDPGGDLGSGALAATTTPFATSGSDQETVNGRSWYRITDFDIVFPASFSWSVRSQTCNEGSQYDIQSTAVHELGHGIGFAHSCEQGEPCQDPDLFNAIMYWQAHNTCGRLDTNEWDLQEQSIAYGLGSTSDLSADVQSGGIPLAVNFTPLLITSSTLISASWNFGDGATSTASAPSHSYTTEGIYSVQADLSANSPACGGAYEQLVRKSDFIKACNPVEAAFHFDHSGKTFHFHSDTQGQVTGCLSSLDWDYGDGTPHGNTNSPTHTYVAGGTYDVTLTATGAAGAAAPLTKSVNTASAKKGCTCSLDGVPTANTAAAAGSLAAALALCGVTLARRRREQTFR